MLLKTFSFIIYCYLLKKESVAFKKPVLFVSKTKQVVQFVYFLVNFSYKENVRRVKNEIWLT